MRAWPDAEEAEMRARDCFQTSITPSSSSTLAPPPPPPPHLTIHTPTHSLTLPHTLNQDSLQNLYDRLTPKLHLPHPQRVGAGWVKYAWEGGVWSLDDDADYFIWAWRCAGPEPEAGEQAPGAAPVAGQTNGAGATIQRPQTPTLHVRDPLSPLPQAGEYQNPSFYAFQRPASFVDSRPSTPGYGRARSIRSVKSTRSAKGGKGKSVNGDMEEGTPAWKKRFEDFHAENGVRTVVGGIGPVNNVRMLLKKGYRHVYLSRSFALSHGFIPSNAAPGMYGYSGLVSLGSWPIIIGPLGRAVSCPVYLSEEAHFDVVLGRSFWEKRGVRIDPSDSTRVWCQDTGEKVECDVVVVRDGRGEIVTVT
ncbi:hypothetical protein DACRYDRAFT_103883 [Dacryopinax primogenitus]|uniref:Uncharacterized protein n=1 Tax=Dacryopinax primogenitus (strain DJM 731) TaxID=1858805 RepID=M5GGF5_DACPD|nr:uncharacterized protein DACRYDRAFT_103883 [Dacryopinax primogenitus]EJU05398.1 hypothetical protein DACRYDRAFT_103883 [Dacryopinax primogenitus]